MFWSRQVIVIDTVLNEHQEHDKNGFNAMQESFNDFNSYS